jgi:hypothetical protein
MFGGQRNNETEEISALRTLLETNSREQLEWLEPLDPLVNGIPIKKRFRHVQKHLGRLVNRLWYLGEHLEAEREARGEAQVEEEDDENRDIFYKAG